DDEAKGIVVPISLTVDISGTPRSGNSPVFFFGDEAAQGPSPSGTNKNGTGTGEQGGTGNTTAATKDDESPMSKLALPVGIGAGVLLLAGITFYALTRRRA
ncbi:hypothetical protein, partial [Streptomyces sp. NPDC000410]|uniref:hypothetical protein n=1 Tax=Streptomyces sp. NPDC000410 TaxID=3154254 RepID=UPI00331E53D0